MKKLIKPGKPIENYSEDQVQAFCEYDGCGYFSCLHFDSSWLENGVDQEDDVLF